MLALSRGWVPRVVLLLCLAIASMGALMFMGRTPEARSEDTTPPAAQAESAGPSGGPVAEPQADGAEGYATWDSVDFRVSLRYPATWSSVYPAGNYVGQERVEGPDGFFQLLGFTAAVQSAEEICRAMAEHKLRPYGSAPRIDRALVLGQDACYVWPSYDQYDKPHREVLLVVRYPDLLPRGRYPREPAAGHLGLSADPTHIQQIAASLRFRPDF